MKKAGIRIVGALVLSVACMTAFAHDFDLYVDEVGNSRLVTLGGYTFADRVTVSFTATVSRDGVVTNLPCTIACGVVYKDPDMRRPPTEEDWKRMQVSSALLNDWLVSYVRESCDGADFDTLCENYGSGDLVAGLQDGFPSYVAARIAEMDPLARINVEAVTVEMKAQGGFSRELFRRLRSK